MAKMAPHRSASPNGKAAASPPPSSSSQAQSNSSSHPPPQPEKHAQHRGGKATSPPPGASDIASAAPPTTSGAGMTHEENGNRENVDSSRPSSSANRAAAAAVTSPSSPGRPPVADDGALAAEEGETKAQEPIRVKFVPYNSFFHVQDVELPLNEKIKIGRFQGSATENEHSDGIYYKSTVVSRRHALIWTTGTEVFVQDTKSLGGTFLNDRRLAATGKESPPVRIKHGDVLQFGVDYRPSQPNQQPREKDRCVQVKVEITPHVKQPRAPRWTIPGTEPNAAGSKPRAISCCICLSSLRMRQTLLVAPCGHLFHYKCVTPMLGKIIFACPLCRDAADLHASVESFADSDSDDGDGEEAIRRLTTEQHAQMTSAREPSPSRPLFESDTAGRDGGAHSADDHDEPHRTRRPSEASEAERHDEQEEDNSEEAQMIRSLRDVRIAALQDPPLISPTFSEQTQTPRNATRPASRAYQEEEEEDADDAT